MSAPFPLGPLLLAPVAEGLLNEVYAFFTARSVALPARRAVLAGAPGVIAWDCEQVTVNLASINLGAGGAAMNVAPQLGPPAGVGLIRSATWAIQLVRCTPPMRNDGKPPSASALHTAGMAALVDAGMLSQCFALVAGHPRGQDRDWLPVGATVNAGAVTSLGPEGPFHAHEAQVTITAMEAAP